MPTTTEVPNTEAEIYHAADTALRASRAAWRQKENELMAKRDAALRQLVGTRRGGLANASRVLRVSDGHVLRLLDEGIVRTVRTALDSSSIERSDYQLIHQRGGRSIGIVLSDFGPSEELVTQALTMSGLSMTGRRQISLSEDALRSKALKAVKRIVQDALDTAQISSGTYRLKEERGEQVVRLTLTEIMEGVKESVQSRFLAVLHAAGLVVIVEEGDSGALLISVPGAEDEPVTWELLFAWSDQDNQV